MRRASVYRSAAVQLAAAAVIASAGQAAAGDFAVSASPPRFELSGKGGDTLRGVIDLGNASRAAGDYKVATADWALDANAAAVFFDALQPGSCRPWVAIERPVLRIQPGARYRYRFEVTIPPSVAAAECRFALMIEGDSDRVSPAGGGSFPVAGRIGIIVYVRVGNARPALSVGLPSTKMVEGLRLPVVAVTNSGTAHDRLSGFLSSVDAAGVKRELAPEQQPILAGETRLIVLKAVAPEDDGDLTADRAGAAAKRRKPAVAVKPIVFPITVSGKLEHDGPPIALTKRFE